MRNRLLDGLVDDPQQRRGGFVGLRWPSLLALSAALPALLALGALELLEHSQADHHQRLRASLDEQAQAAEKARTILSAAAADQARLATQLEASTATASLALLQAQRNASESIASAQRVLGTLAEPPSMEPRIWRWLPFVAALAGVLLAMLLGYWRLTRPLNRALEAARSLVHGEGAHFVARGGPEAREVARAFSALVERGERLRAQDRQADSADLRRIAEAIQRLGEGGLSGSLPPVNASFAPLAQAVEAARAQLLERLATLHAAATAAAEAVIEVSPAARVIATAAADESQTLAQLATESEKCAAQVVQSATGFEVSVAAATKQTKAQREVGQQLKAQLSMLRRRLEEARGLGERAQKARDRMAQVDRALEMLARGAKNAEGAKLGGEARAALVEVQRGLDELVATLSDATALLDASTLHAPEPVELDREAVGALQRGLSAAQNSVEVVLVAVRGLGRGAQGRAQAAARLAGASSRLEQGLPELGEALGAVRLGGAFEDVLLEKLARAQREAQEARAAGRLTPSGEALLESLGARAETTRQRLAELVKSLEAAVTALRSG